MSAMAAYESGMRSGGGCWINGKSGARVELPVWRWIGVADDSDLAVLNRCDGPTLDVGCGPGRLTLGLAQRGIETLGIDISREAVRLAIDRGANAECHDVFDKIPGGGGWSYVILADGNIGIGGAPVRLLKRARELITADGSVIVEVEPRGRQLRRRRIRLEADGHRGWLPWAHVGADAIGVVAEQSGLTVRRLIVQDSGRHIAELCRADTERPSDNHGRF